MANRQISFTLVFLLLCPLLMSAQADGEDDLNFEAKNLTAVYDNVEETTTISWGNADTNNYLILEELKTTNYTLYRSDEPLNTSNYPQSELIQDGIQACMPTDSFTQCKERTHQVVYQVPPATDGNYYYGVTSTLENGTVVSNFTVGDGGLLVPIHEYGSSIKSPYNLQASYDVENATTHLSWIDAGSVDASLSANRTTSVWQHDVQVDRSNWNSTNKTEIISNLSSGVVSYDIVHASAVSRVVFYTVLHEIEGEVDLRFLSGNTLAVGLVEDNVGSSITGVLQANFNHNNNVTSLNWSGAVVEDATHTLHVWRSPSPILDLAADGVQELAQLPANATHFNHTVEAGFSGTSYYMITLSDLLGNQQTGFISAPKANTNEYTLADNENIVQNLAGTYSSGTTHLTWSDLSGHPEAEYQIWRSTEGNIFTDAIVNGDATLIATVNAGVEHYNHTLPSGVSGDAWYAVTVVASFGTQDVRYAQTNISLALNSLFQPLSEDTAAPVVPTSLDAVYRPDGRTQLSWSGSADETGTVWTLYRNLNSDLSEEGFWVEVGTMENTGDSVHNVFVDTVAQAGEIVNAVYAIGGEDSFGNTVSFEDWTLSSTVREDRQPPQVQMKLFDAADALETSRWFSGGEEAMFSNLEVGAYSLQLTTGDDIKSVMYTLSTETTPTALNPNGANPSIDVVLAEDAANFSIAFVVTDNSGNIVSFDVLFCTSCLIQPEVIIKTEEAVRNDNVSTGETDSESNNILIGVCVLLSIIVAFLLTKGGPRKKAPRGLPSRREDQWISKYTGEP